MPRSLWRWAHTKEMASKVHVFNRWLGVVLECSNTYKDGCSASAARQAVGGGRGAVVKPRTPQGPSTGAVLWVGGLSTAGVMGDLK
jgi:hypothetical protein